MSNLPDPPKPPDHRPSSAEETANHEFGELPTHLEQPSNAPIPIAGKAQAAPLDVSSWEGRRLGTIVIERALAKGGMGMVLRGVDEALRRPVAVKVMDPALAAEPDALSRFQREARATAAVNHPNVANVFGVSAADDGTPYLVMEYLEGGSMLELIRSRESLSFARVTQLMEQVCLGLQAAQRVGIIHRDIKPANVMLDLKGNAKLVDFGLAKIFYEDSFRTKEGMVLGTPTYMAPEQGQGRSVDHRADIYSVGAMFYHVILGRPPFIADSPVQVMMKHVTAPVIPMRSVNPTVPIEFDEIIGRCLRKDVDERYQDYDELLTDVRRLRLMCTTREQGAFVVGGASGVGVAAGSSLLPPPGEYSGVRTAQLSPMNERTVNYHAAAPAPTAAPEPEEGGLTMVHFAMLGGVAIVVFAGALLYMVNRKQAEAAAEAATDRRPALAIALERLVEQSQQDPAQVARDQFDAFSKTLDIMTTLRRRVAVIIAEDGAPDDLSQVVDESKMVINFEVDEAGFPLDGWGNPVHFEPSDRMIISAGMDGEYFTPDDLTSVVDGETTTPLIYEDLSQQVRRSP